MVPDGYWWFLMVIDCYWWLLMVIDGSWWLLMVPDGYWLLLMVIDGYWWFLMVIDGSWWLLIVIDGYWWLLMVPDGSWLLLSVIDGLVHFGTFWKIIWVHSSGLEVAYDMLGAYYEYGVLWQWSIPKKWCGSSWYVPYQNNEKCICIPLTCSTDCFSHQDRDLEQAYIRCLGRWVISPSWNG